MANGIAKDVKISETQRKYFAQRINEEFNSKIALMRQQEARGIQELSSTSIQDYMDTIGVKAMAESFRRKEKAYENAKKKMNTVISNLEDADPTDEDVKSRYNYYNSCSVYNYKDVEKYFDMKCNQLAKVHYRKRNKVVSELEDKRKAAVDYIYGMTKNSDLVKGLARVLKGTDIKFQLGGKDVHQCK